MARQIITKEQVQAVLSSGRSELVLDERDIVTALATEFAQQNSLRIVRGTAERPRADSPVLAVQQRVPMASAAQVRQAVIAAYGSEPAGLDAAIAKVLKQ